MLFLSLRGIRKRTISDQLATLLEIPTEEVETTLGVAARHVSMDAPFIDGEDNSLIDVLENNSIQALILRWNM